MRPPEADFSSSRVSNRLAPARPQVRGPFVAAAVRRVRPEEGVDAAEHFVREPRAPPRVGLDEQRRRQHVRVDPRVPVVRPARAGREAHPPPVVAGLIGREHAPLDFARQPRAHERRDGVEPVAQEIPRPCQRVRGLGREQVDNRLGGIGQAAPRLLGPLVRRHGPRGLLGDCPRRVGDGVEEAAPVLHALGHHERLEAVAPGEHGALEPAAVAGARVVEKQRGRELGERLCQDALAARDEAGADAGGDARPGVAIGNRRQHAPGVAREENRLDPRGRPVGGQRRGFHGPALRHNHGGCERHGDDDRTDGTSAHHCPFGRISTGRSRHPVTDA